MDAAPICQRERQMKERQREGGVKEKVRMTFLRKMECAIMLLAFKRRYKLMHICLHLQSHGHTQAKTHTRTHTRCEHSRGFPEPPSLVLGQ